jgi:hypothetical protein
MRTIFLCCCLIAMGCAADPSSTATESMDLGGSGMGGFGMGGPPPGIAHLSCGAQPQKTMTTVCGRPVPSAIHLAWTGCSPEAGVTTTGSVDVTMTISGDCSAGTLTGTRDVHVALDITRNGATSHRDGTFHGTFSGAPPFGPMQ